MTRTLNEEDFARDRHIVKVEYSSTIDFFNEVWRKERRHLPVAKLTEFILNRLDVHLPAEVKSSLVKDFKAAIFNDPPPLVKDAKRVLESLHGRYGIGLISNSGVTPGRNLRQVLNNHKVLQYFSCTVFSDEVGYHKPHPIIFRKAIGKLQVEASDAVHVGDILEADVVGVKAVGMKAVWFNMAEKNWQKDEIQFVPDYEIENLTELTEILCY